MARTSTVCMLCTAIGLLLSACVRTEQASEAPAPSAQAPTVVEEQLARTPPPPDSQEAVRAHWRQAIAERGGDPESVPLNPSPPSDAAAGAPAPAQRDAVRQQWLRAIEERGNR